MTGAMPVGEYGDYVSYISKLNIILVLGLNLVLGRRDVSARPQRRGSGPSTCRINYLLLCHP